MSQTNTTKAKMTSQVQLGHVNSLFSHVKEDWWKDAFNEIYLRTDGDVVEDPSITKAECEELLSIEGVAKLFNLATETSQAIRVLDLCCGQGRHSIHLSEKYPLIDFKGLDSSIYLIELAKRRAQDAGCQNTSFQVGDARHIPYDDNTFDLTILMGNSFGVYSSEDDNARLLEEVGRTLKPGGIFLVDLVSADYTKSSFRPGGWEFINGGKVDMPYSKGSTGDPGSDSLIACRERELSEDGKWLASRELVINLSGGLRQDLFYKLRLYEVEEMELLLRNAGMELNKQACQELLGPASQGNRNDDLGMMAARHLLVAVATVPSNGEDRSIFKPDPSKNFFVHPYLKIDIDPVKGRVVRSTSNVKAGTLLMVDNPFALVPDITQGSGDFLPCSRLECSKRVTDPSSSVSCPNVCNPEVIWCNSSCRELDKARHEIECSWLKQNTATILQEQGQYDFTMLWIIVRILASRSLEKEQEDLLPQSLSTVEQADRNDEYVFTHSYHEVDKLRSNRNVISPSKIEHYYVLVNAFLTTESGFQGSLGVEELVDLICKEEMNAFCLYPKGTGMPGVTNGRGRAYGLGLYTRATWMNHDCDGNMSHKPNRNSQYMFRTTRDLAAGEECTIAYFDLTEPQHADVHSRRAFLKEWFTFDCMCRRCLKELEVSE
ncbi:hypothetical protein ONS95_004327 [Cadophora gregata]|uniref:uncharacterized protein n=1 Tax=Cadophora gregata TaxID=51156 RepID=UPI0026DCD768|nr:uncharacterized protein ONS95_004327 [Cadophora gregata]KAK0105289.1 hypothetical protein ONS96_004685 [Cadophora gregata f. sp. sojae]KAK0105810.1 hypothetical protein ONS95_004327 [Cadophora gregata]